MAETIEADVVVVGGGGAGLAAASSAAGLGRHVILIEKGATLGGTTAWSVGSISATNTPHQRRAGIKDTPREHFEDLGLLAGAKANRDNLALRQVLADNTTEMFAWLMSTGLVSTGPNVEPPHRYPRMHNVLPNSRAFPAALGRHCRRLGVDIRLGSGPSGCWSMTDASWGWRLQLWMASSRHSAPAAAWCWRPGISAPIVS